MSKSSNKSKANSKQPLRVAVRCSWSGARLAVPSSATTTPAITAATNLATVISTLVNNGSLPAAILDDSAIGGGGAPSLVYARTAVPRDRWGNTTLGDLVGGEGSGGSGGIMLVLNLGGGGAAGGGGGQGAAAAVALAPATSAPTAAAPKVEDTAGTADTTAASSSSSAGPSAAATATSAEPMEIDATSTTTTPTTSTTTNATPTEALATLLSSNFDADLRPCLLTLIRILDNVISKPHEPKVRTIKLSNPAFRNKVGRCRGGVEVLVCCGFERRRTGVRSMFDGGGGNDAEADVIVLPPDSGGDDTAARLVSMRHLLAQRAVQVLGMDEKDLPKYKGPPRPVVLVAGSGGGGGGGAGGGVGGGSRGGSNTFDPYRTHSYNAQAAASGAADPHAIGGIGGGGISRTEKELNALKSKQERLERKLQKLGPGGRALAAFRPGTVGSVGVVSSPADDHGGAGTGAGKSDGKGDGSLLAARMKRLEEERRKREEGGFTTKAMRDLESMKKAKVYTHATLRIGFADGCWITAKFLPSETVEAVRTVLREECFREDVAHALDFDLYVAPPRRKLDGAKRLDAEGLVPAARVHVSWKVGGTPAQAKGQPPGSYLREELFQTNGGTGQTDYNAAAFPNAQKLVDDDDKKEGGKKRPAGNGAGSSAVSAESREEALMARMLGKKPGLLGGRSGGDAGKKKSSSGKPKWFK